jgi:hypothetical protein
MAGRGETSGLFREHRFRAGFFDFGLVTHFPADCTLSLAIGKKSSEDFGEHVLGGMSELDSWMDVLCLATLLSRRHCARMPLLVLGVAIAEPPTASGAMHCREIIARLIARRYSLTEAL